MRMTNTKIGSNYDKELSSLFPDKFYYFYAPMLKSEKKELVERVQDQPTLEKFYQQFLGKYEKD